MRPNFIILIYSIGLAFAPSLTPKSEPLLWVVYYSLLVILSLFIPVPKNYIWAWALFFRVLTLGREPNFSEDWMRFAWDGKLILLGYSPFTLTPADAWNVLSEQLISKDWEYLFRNMNSPNYYSVYPFFLQAFFALGGMFGVKAYLVFQFLTLVFAVAVAYSLQLRSTKVAWFFASQPLAVLESVSQAHPEIIFAWALLFLLAPTSNSKSFWGSVLAMQAKLSFIFVPLGAILWRANHFSKIILGTALSAFLFFGLNFFSLNKHWQGGFGLFFHSFQFHGLVSGLTAPIFNALGYGWGNGFFSIFCYLIALVHIKKKNMQGSYLFWVIGLLVVFSPTIHPWYLLPVFVLWPKELSLFPLFVYAWTSGLSYWIYSGEINRFLYALGESLILVFAISYTPSFWKATYFGTGEDTHSQRF